MKGILLNVEEGDAREREMLNRIGSKVMPMSNRDYGLRGG
jgi:hypothetical protein